MNNLNPESIPTYIFDWLEKYSFLALSDEQKKEVLTHFSEEEYDELHTNVLAINSVHEPAFTENSSVRKQELLDRFETHHTRKKTSFVFYNTLWKAAAALVLLGSGWILNYLIPGKTASQVGSVTMIDTVYLTKEIIPDPVKIYDTIYTEKKSEAGSFKKDVYSNYTQNRTIKSQAENSSALYLNEMGSTLNRQKRNSMKDDSLVKEFSVIML